MKEDTGSWFTFWKRRYGVLDQDTQELRFYKRMVRLLEGKSVSKDRFFTATIGVR